MTDDNISRLAAEKAIHKAIADQCLTNGNTSAGQYLAVAVKAIRALPRQPTQSDVLEAENERLRGIVYRYVDPFDVTPEDEEFVQAAQRAALKESK
jgi:hypothetical protein